jgi:hypothetical protein
MQIIRILAGFITITSVTALGASTAFASGPPNPNGTAYMVTAAGATPIAKFIAGAGQTNNLTITSTSTTVVYDDDVPITAGVGCVHTTPDATVVTCYHPTGSIVDATAYLYDGNDSAVIYGDDHLWDVRVYGGTGDDLLKEADSNAYSDTWLYGEAGNDYLDDELTGEHRSWLDGGDGNDYLYCKDGTYGSVMVGGNGADVFAGHCMVDYSARTTPVNVSIDGVANDGSPGEGDNVQTSVLGVQGGSGNDVLYSEVGATLVGNGGADFIVGSDYRDSIFADDGVGGDTVIGGGSYDDCHADPGDNVSSCP